jgi:hypothetical protein
VLFGVNHHEHLRLKVVSDRGDKSIDFTEPMRLERIFMSGVKPNRQGHLILDAIYPVHVRVDRDNLCAFSEKTNRGGPSKLSQSDDSVFHDDFRPPAAQPTTTSSSGNS